MLLQQITSQITPPTSIMQQFQQVRGAWFAAIFPLANTLFGILALLELAVTGTFLALERTDWLSWTAGFIRKVLWLSAFYALLLFGQTWIPAIINSLSMVGGIASGIAPEGVSPGLVWSIGVNITGFLLDAASNAGYMQIGTSLSLTLASMCVFLCFVAISCALVMALIESYICVGAGVIFLGFGASRLTTPYVERYLGLAVAIGVKLMVLQLLVGVSMSLAIGWVEAALMVPRQASPAMSAWEIAGSAVILLVICWQCPKFVAGMIGGTPAFAGGELISLGVGAIGMGAEAAVLGATAVQTIGTSAAAAGGSAAKAGGSAMSAMSVSAAAGFNAGGSATANAPSMTAAAPAPSSGGITRVAGTAALMANAGARVTGAVPKPPETPPPPPPPINLRGEV